MKYAAFFICAIIISLTGFDIAAAESPIRIPSQIEITSGYPDETAPCQPAGDVSPPLMYSTDDTTVEIFGDQSSPWSGTNRDRGNIFHVTTTVNLYEHRFFLDVTSAMPVCFFIFQGSSGPTGTFNLVDSVTVNITPGRQFFASGERNFELQSGNYYYIGAAWSVSAGYFRGGPATPLPCSFGTLETGIPGNICNGFPPSATATNTYTGFPGYHAAIVTGIISNVMVTPTPINPPIILPNGGGTFSFEAMVENSTPSAITFDAWTEIILPNGAVYGPVVQRGNIVIPGNGAFTRTLTQFVPWNAPPGNYIYVGNVGLYPDSIWHFDDFEFSKLFGDAPPHHQQGWAAQGWEEAMAPVALNPPDRPVLLTASPNPFNPSTGIDLFISEAGQVDISVYDIGGREVAGLYNGYLGVGKHHFTFSGAELPSGIYFIRASTGEKTAALKTMLIK